MGLRSDLLNLLQHAYEREQDFLAGLSEQTRAECGLPDDWSAKDLIAHVAAWKERTVCELTALAKGQPAPEFGDLDEFNARVFADHRDLDWERVVSTLELTHRQLCDAILATPDELLVRPRSPDRPDELVWWIVVARGVNHPLGHLAERLAEEGQIDQAAQMQEQVAALLLELDTDPRWHSYVHYGLARVYAGLGWADKTACELAMAVDLNPDLAERARTDSRLAVAQESIRRCASE